MQERSGKAAGESGSHTTVCSLVTGIVGVKVFRRKQGIARARAERTRKGREAQYHNRNNNKPFNYVKWIPLFFSSPLTIAVQGSIGVWHTRMTRFRSFGSRLCLAL